MTNLEDTGVGPTKRQGAFTPTGNDPEVYWTRPGGVENILNVKMKCSGRFYSHTSYRRAPPAPPATTPRLKYSPVKQVLKTQHYCKRRSATPARWWRWDGTSTISTSMSSLNKHKENIVIPLQTKLKNFSARLLSLNFTYTMKWWKIWTSFLYVSEILQT